VFSFSKQNKAELAPSKRADIDANKSICLFVGMSGVVERAVARLFFQVYPIFSRTT
jgi:hypothetical protein